MRKLRRKLIEFHGNLLKIENFRRNPEKSIEIWKNSEKFKKFQKNFRKIQFFLENTENFKDFPKKLWIFKKSRKPEEFYKKTAKISKKP